MDLALDEIKPGLTRKADYTSTPWQSDVTDYVAASTECHRLSRPEAEGVTEREMTW